MCVNVDIDIEFEVEEFAKSFNHFINGENFICESGSFRRSGEYLPLLETFGTKYVRALEPLIREKMRLPENKGISRVVDRLNLNQNLLFEEFISPYLSCEPDPDFEYAKTEFLRAKRNVTKLFNRIFHFAFDERKVICENLETTINAISACVVDSRYNRFGYDFMGLFRYYYQKEINNKKSNNESKEVSSEETNENEKLNEEKSNVINQFKFQIFDLRVKSFSTRQHKFCDHGNRFDEVLYFKNLKEFVRNVFLCELYNENTVLKKFCEEIYPEREIRRFVKPSFYDELFCDETTDIDFRIKINKEWYKETLIIKKKLTSNFNKLYKTFYKDRWLILENLDKIFDPIINDYKKDGTFQLKENHSEINEKDQENEINENESSNELEVPSEEINNNNDKDQENETNENENNNTKKDPWFFVIRNAKVEVGV